MKLKGVRHLERTINNFLAPFGCTCFLGADFGYYPALDTIEIALVSTKELNTEFMNSVLRHDPAVSADVFLWSLLHELGHHETYELLSNIEIACCEFLKAQIKISNNNSNSYYDLPDETLATEWAIEYAETHAQELAKAWPKMQKAILHFYKVNNVEDK